MIRHIYVFVSEKIFLNLFLCCILNNFMRYFYCIRYI
nr:MAG TPA: Fibroblast growth factor 13, Sodium hand and IQ motif.02A [Caudoviricetes sp.]DAG14538.1 MAG TPA: Fibroblast growth factor 13, Sodium hand and IQ motif.02A [Caudoviricetes sp.]DAO25212.1 MAG TPA: Fibroblast growth factor 13, Sodium hand and IQ motif.02A [Caudoviricetes sp.]